MNGRATLTVSNLGREQGFYPWAKTNQFGNGNETRFDPGQPTEVELRISLPPDTDIGQSIDMIRTAIQRLGIHVE